MIQRDLSTRLMMLFSEFRKQEEYSRFGTNLSGKTKDTLRKGELILELLKQNQYEELKQEVQVILLSLVFTRFLEKKERPFLEKHKQELIHAIVNDSRLQDLRTLARDKVTTFDTFIKEVDAMTDIFESICLQ